MRDPYLNAIERFLKKLKDMPHHLGKARHKAIQKLINTHAYSFAEYVRMQSVGPVPITYLLPTHTAVPSPPSSFMKATSMLVMSSSMALSITKYIRTGLA